MKLIIILLVAGSFQANASGYAQQITLNEKNASVKTVINHIRQQSGYDFFGNLSLLKNANPVTVNLKNASIEEALKQTFSNQPFTYIIDEKTIIIKEKEPSLVDKIKAEFASPVNISGKITDSTGTPLAGANVKLESTNYTAVSDSKGSFIFNAVPLGAYTITVTYVGYQTLERIIQVESSVSNLNLVLHNSTNPLDEVNIIGYGTTTKRFNVGSISKVSAAEIAQQPVTNVLTALEGRAPGLLVTQTSGVPGAGVNIQIRGQNTLGGADNPLFIVDGVPLATQNASLNQIQSFISSGNILGASAFNNINPADIESIEILKDADATAIYGSRGANGVILITTKKGKAGKTRFSATVSTGESHVTRTMPMMNTQQYLEMRNEALKNDGLTASANANDPGYAPDLTIFDTTKYTDWKKYFIGGTTHFTDANASVSGGSENTQFLIGAGYHREGYIYPGNFSDNKASVNANIHHTSNNKLLTLDFSVNYNFDENNSSPGAFVGAKAFTLAPDHPDLFNSDGSLNLNYKGVRIKDNPMGYTKQKYVLQTYNLLSHFQVDYQVLPGLTIRSSFGYNTVDNNEQSQIPKTALALYNQGNPINSNAFGTNNFSNWIIEPQLEYKKQFGKGKLNVLAGSSFQQNINNSTVITGKDYSSDDLLGSIDGAGTVTANNNYSLYKYSAVFGRVNYIWNNKYIVNVTGRRDGSSRFGPGRRFGNFGSVATGWLFSEENFIKNNMPFLSHGKLSASYGSTGSDEVGDYQYNVNWRTTSSYSNYQGSSGLMQANLSNPDYSWALTKKLEAGIDLGFLKDHITAGIEWYRNRCGNQLVYYALPAQTGFNSITQNFPAVVQNKGLEVVLGGNAHIKNFSWSGSANFTFPQNKLLSFPGLESSSYAYTYVVGKSLEIERGVRYLDVNKETGIYEFSDESGKPVYDPPLGKPSDYYIIGNTDAKFYGGLSNTFTYKTFSINIFFEFRKQSGTNYKAQILENYSFPGVININQPVAVLSRWQKPGDITDVQKFSIINNYDVLNSSSYFNFSSGGFSDASYIRLKTLSFAYNLPANFLKKIKLESLKIFVNAQNVFTITKFLGNDPETQNFYGLPPLKTIIAGLQFNL